MTEAIQAHLDALRNENDGFAITVWADGWKLWTTLDARYAEHEPGWIMTISGDQILEGIDKLALSGHEISSWARRNAKELAAQKGEIVQ